ncbi:MAG: T9SS type A sorting domain-containing protein [Bacteroidota bacterium]|nr:T9SS type A sorting domain-containing protein [Bacteroidota bacterium]
MSFDDLAGTSIRIADDAYTNANNAMYYVSLWGDNVTGEIKNRLLDEAGMGQLQVYPNPVKDDHINLIIPAEISGQVQVRLIDMHANLKYKQIKVADRGEMHLDIQGLTNGVYLISVSCESGQYQTRFILAR